MTTVRPHQQNYPVFMDLAQRRVIVAGGGKTAARKVTRLLDSGAHITLIAPVLIDSLAALALQGKVTYAQKTPDKDDLRDAVLLFAASEDNDENLRIAGLAQQHNCMVNVANLPSASSFLVPSLIDRAPLLLAVSSTGVSPVLARLLTARIEAFLPDTYKDLGKLAQRYKDQIIKQIPDWRLRRRFWEKLLCGRVGERILQGQLQDADVAMHGALKEFNAEQDVGEVYLVGAGPGDPDLLSFRALRLMQQCDVVLYDRLVSDEIMALINASAERIYVGKQRSHHAVQQESINSQLASLAKQGKRVLRLKGGDPFMFGRGGEEIETLAAQGVNFQIVPGITAATGCASYAGIPLTHRDHAQACLFVTGHLKDGTVDLDWQALARANQTLVIYMGLVGLPIICEKLIEHGLTPTHPIALVAQGTTSRQKIVSGTLIDITEKLATLEIKPPTLIIVGTVVGLRDKLAWFEKRQ